jgi:hypothetical protein
MNQLAESLMGHDKGCLYAIVDETDGMVFLADGNSRRLDHPKKKNPKHIRRVVHLPKEIASALGAVSRDSDLIYVLRRYQALVRERNSMKDAEEKNHFRSIQILQNEGNEVKKCPSQM